MKTGMPLKSPLRAAVLAVLAACGGLAVAKEDRPLVLDTRPVPAAATASVLPEGWQHGAFIEIFVRGYKDSDGDGIGDLRGLTQSLDYLRDLGVRGIWLMPVTRSQDHDHGYAVSDYRDIEPAYGTLADFDELVKQAHARGIGIIFDYVINHSAASNPIFVEASRAPDSRYRDWYVWRDPAPSGWNILGKDPWVRTTNGAYLAQFSRTMPDFNFLEPEVIAYHKDNLRFWLNRGIDGFRFDAVTHLIENGPDAWHDQPGDYAVMAEIRALVDTYSHRYVVCEATLNAAAYAAPSVCGSAFALDAGKKIVAAANGDRAAVADIAHYFLTAPTSMATLISNHDLFAGERLWDQVHGDPRKYRLAAASYLLMPGTPFIYYGEEIGMSAGPGLQGDAKLRTPMSWTGDSGNAGFSTVTPYRVVAANVTRQNVDAEQKAPDSLLAYYKSLLALRNRFPAIAQGSYEKPFVDGLVMAYQRRLREQGALVVINYGAKPASMTLSELDAGAAFKQVFPEAGAGIRVDAGGRAKLKVPAQSVRVFVR
jgi:glycosidase